ncbi:DUF2382 domain-containing protein [Aquipuribacter sp. MA13-6]|uniref:DUF2382 domain-containing protein n=1 Tax=unclassified Aquipuribacter TaxID=2635084 RepID=UPI003EEC0AD8
MITTNEIDRVTGTTIYTNDGDKIGSANQVYLDDATGEPQWVTVNTGLFGTSESFVPLSEAVLRDDRLEVPFDKKTVKDAPRLGESGHLSPAEEDELYRHYGLADAVGVGNGQVGMGTVDARDAGTRGAGHDTSGPSTDDAMTRSEEHLEVGTQERETGRARLRKYVTTETETVQVPVKREEVRLEREPITGANAGDAHDGPAISEEEHEVVLHEERPVVTTEAVPVERVRAEKETVVDTETVSGEVRKEHIDLDDTASTTGDRAQR